MASKVSKVALLLVEQAILVIIVFSTNTGKCGAE